MAISGGRKTVLRLSTGIEVHALIHAGNASKSAKCLLLHGNPGSLRDWDRVAPRLTSVADVVAIDLPGFGQSPRPGSDAQSMGLERLADHTLAAARALGWNEAVFLVGHSHGGGVAQVAAARQPEAVAGIVLLGTLGFPEHSSYRRLSVPGLAQLASLLGKGMKSRLLRPIIRAALRGAMKDVFSPEEVPEARVERELSLFTERPEILRSMVDVALGRPCELLLACASNGGCPAFFLHGEDDRVVPLRCARSIHERMVRSGRHTTFESLARAGHMLLDFQAQLVAERITAFVSHPPHSTR